MICQRIAYNIATCGIIGYSYAPGTMASLVTAIVMFFVPSVALPCYVVGVAIMIIFAVLCSCIAEKMIGKTDPSVIVIDEVVGMMIALTCIPKTMISYVLALVFFRVFDIGKPFPVSWAEKRFNGGLAIVMDDVIAGVIAGCCYWLVSWCL